MKIEIYTEGDSLYDAEDVVNIVKYKLQEGYSQFEGEFGSRWFSFHVTAPTWKKQKESQTPIIDTFNAVKSKSEDSLDY